MLYIMNSAQQNDHFLIMVKEFYILLYLFGAMLKHSIPLSTIKTDSKRHNVRGSAWVFFHLLQNLISEMFMKVIFEWIQKKFWGLTVKKFRVFRSKRVREKYFPTKSKWFVKKTAYGAKSSSRDIFNKV